MCKDKTSSKFFTATHLKVLGRVTKYEPLLRPQSLPSRQFHMAYSSFWLYSAICGIMMTIWWSKLIKPLWISINSWVLDATWSSSYALIPVLRSHSENVTYIGIQPKNKIGLTEHFLWVKDILYKMEHCGLCRRSEPWWL